jgi:uncharacterized membrane protein
LRRVFSINPVYAAGLGGTILKRDEPTDATLISFQAVITSDGQISLDWQTGFEADNLGFHIYREQNGKRARITQQLIAGSALIAGSRTALTAGKTYTLRDRTGGKESRYWLETVFAAQSNLAEAAPHCTPWFQLDRGADCWQVFALARRARMLITVRATHDRKLDDQAGASVVQTTTGIIQLRNNDIMGGNINLAFSVFTWQACIETLLKALQIIPADTAAVDGWLYLMMGLVLLGFTPISFKVNTAAAMFIAGADIFFLGTTYALLLGSSTVGFYAAWGLVLCVISCLWQGVGITLNSLYGKEVIGFGPPLLKMNSGEAA